MGYTQGQKITVSHAGLYYDSYRANPSGYITGTYYIWRATISNGRIAVTNRTSYVGKLPASKYVTGWINTSSIQATAESKPPEKPPEPELPVTKPEEPDTKVHDPTPPESQVTPTGTSPGQIGYLGTVIFVVSNDQLKTIEDFVESGSASWVEHARHLKKPKLEFTGANAGEITFKFTLSAYLGASPKDDYEKLKEFMEGGIAVPFKIGGTRYGSYRWVIQKMSRTGTASDKDGDWTQIEVQISLKEYAQ